MEENINVPPAVSAELEALRLRVSEYEADKAKHTSEREQARVAAETLRKENVELKNIIPIEVATATARLLTDKRAEDERTESLENELLKITDEEERAKVKQNLQYLSDVIDPVKRVEFARNMIRGASYDDSTARQVQSELNAARSTPQYVPLVQGSDTRPTDGPSNNQRGRFSEKTLSTAAYILPRILPDMGYKMNVESAVNKARNLAK